MNKENKQWMYGEEYRDALDQYIESLPYDEIENMLKDFIFEYMENHMTNEQVHEFVTTGEW